MKVDFFVAVDGVPGFQFEMPMPPPVGAEFFVAAAPRGQERMVVENVEWEIQDIVDYDKGERETVLSAEVSLIPREED